MVNSLLTFAATETGEQTGLFEALGIDWRLLVLQIIAFGILVWLLGKFIYPILIKAIDKRDAAIAESLSAAKEAEEKAEASEHEVEKLLKEARSEAATIVDTAHKEANAQVKEAEEKAKKRAEQIVSDAREQLQQDVTKARAALRNETTELVALATEKIIREKVDAKSDKALIERAIKDAA
ncbi:MAG: F0F1 ATP synthase subunit B [Candidatus Saccharimonadales bacterium]